MIAGGAGFIQLREKHASPHEFYDAALEVMRTAPGIKILINDRVDIALAVKAAGVHLGQDDMPPEKARVVLGDAAIIGYSTHTIEQVLSAARLPVDYIAFGPIFGTTTKTHPDAIVGLGGLSQAREAAGDMPFVAIGGINLANVKQVFAAGADSAAIIGAVVANPGRIPETFNDLNNLAEEGVLKYVGHG